MPTLAALLVLLFPAAAMAHPGHGVVEGLLLHYIFEHPQIAAASTVVVTAAVVGWLAMRRED